MLAGSMTDGDRETNLATVKKWLTDTIYPSLVPHQANPSEFIPYGTAGFRANSEKIKPMLGNISVCAAMRSFLTDEHTGIMITASHNPIQDNGVKIIKHDGSMLEPEWEHIFEIIANSRSITAFKDDALDIITEVVYKYASKVWDAVQAGHDKPRYQSEFGRIFIGRDTRPSSLEFADLIKQTLTKIQVDYKDLGVLTTPAFHYLIAEATNTDEDMSVNDYYNMLLNGFVELNSSNSTNSEKKFYNPSSLIVDCANGVGLKTMEYLLNNPEFRELFPIELINTSSKPDDVLNHECGADFVKTKQLPPRAASELNKKYASLDGDADRVVYFFLTENNDSQLKLNLLDGDKILVLFVKYLQDMLKKYDLVDKLTLGAIQTAYANGASTDYLRNELEVKNIDCVDTGVKNLHKKALEYDLGVYFEANGHGTIWVSERAKHFFEIHQANELRGLLKILNNYTGDAVSDILIAETILKHYDWDAKKWYEMYQDRANSLIKVEIADRNVIETTDAARQCTKPEGLQEYINELVGEFGPASRSFVRASGTENVVRIYAEAGDQESADKLSRLVGDKVIELCTEPTTD